MCPGTYSQVAACTIIILHILSVTALTLKNVSTQIIACEDEAVQLKWEYQLNPNEYVDAKTWSFTKNENTILIARWRYKDGPILQSNFNNTVTIIGNDSLIIRNITARDGGTYTLTLFIRQSSQDNPKLALNLTVLKPPLKDCCKPAIQRLENRTGLRANLDPQACGTGPFELKWNNASGTMSNGDLLIFLASNLTGRFTVCVTGLSIETCFKGKRESLCQDENIDCSLTSLENNDFHRCLNNYALQTETLLNADIGLLTGKSVYHHSVNFDIEEMRKFPQTTEQNIPLVAGLSFLGTLVFLAVILFIIIKINWRRIQKYRGRNKKWKTVRASLNFEDDDILLQSLILTQEVVMDKVTKEISNIMYVIFKNSRELTLEEINTIHIELENSEIIYIDNATDSGDGGTIMENRQTNPSYAQSFYHKDKLLKLLVVQGELGIGNTTWCRKLVSTWCKAYENQYLGIPIQTNDENVQTMKSFPLLFFVSLRNADKGQTLAKRIKQQFVMGSVTQNGHFDFNLDMLMNKSPDKIIIIINDVDEAYVDVDILNEIVSQTKNSLTILTCSDWEPIQSKCRIHEEDCRPMAYITLKHT